jgi:hypothetical protein
MNGKGKDFTHDSRLSGPGAGLYLIFLLALLHNHHLYGAVEKNQPVFQSQ